MIKLLLSTLSEISTALYLIILFGILIGIGMWILINSNIDEKD